MYGIFRMATPLKSAFRRGVTNRRLLSPAASRYVSGNGNTEKVASCLVKPFTSNLNIVEEQRALSAAKSIKLEEDKSKSVDSWYRKGALERFVGFVGTKGSSHQSSSNSGAVTAEEECTLTEFSLMNWSEDLKDWFDEYGDKFITVFKEIFPAGWKKKMREGGIKLMGKRTKIRSHDVEDGMELILECGGFDAKDLLVVISGRVVHVIGHKIMSGLKVDLDKRFKVRRSMWFNPEKATANVELGSLMIHLPKSDTQVRSNVSFRVLVKEVEYKTRS